MKIIAYIAPWLLAFVFMVLLIEKTLECISLSDALTRLEKSDDGLKQADDRLQRAATDLQKLCSPFNVIEYHRLSIAVPGEYELKIYRDGSGREQLNRVR